MKKDTKKKLGIAAAIAAGIGAVLAALGLRKKKNRDKIKEKFNNAKSRTVSATKSAASKAGKAVADRGQTPLEDVKGIGPATAKKLRRAGIKNAEDLAARSSGAIADTVGKATAKKIRRAAKRVTK